MSQPKRPMRLITEAPRLKLVEVNNADAKRLFLLTGNKQVMEFFPKYTQL